MRRILFFALLTVTTFLFADGSGVTSRVRITADESNRNWEQSFFGDRLRTITKNGETADDLSATDADNIAQETQKISSDTKAPVLKGKRTVEYHIIQESSEEGKGSRKVKKRVIIEPNKPDVPAPHK